VGEMKKAIHYINQFFGQIGGEDKADFEPEIREGVVGPGLLLNNLLAPEVEVTHTIICGDNFFGSNKHAAIEMILSLLRDKEFDVFIAGPAFMAGRYGFACGEICKAVQERFGVPVVTSMYVENPAVEMFHKDIYIFSGGDSAGSMRKDVPTMARFVKKLVTGAELLTAKEEGYFPKGVRLESFKNPPVLGADRVVDMLLKKLKGEAIETEMPMPKVNRVPIASAIIDLGKATIALVNSGGIVPAGNPDRIQSASATKWGKYDISSLDTLKAGEWQTIHAGFDPSFANANPNVIVPLDALREYEREGRIGKLHNYVYSTVGTGTTQADASRMGQEIAQQLRDANVSAVILTST
jgi:glycine/betaine/sarcosine/D-proline reductase family selenoprotein B